MIAFFKKAPQIFREVERELGACVLLLKMLRSFGATLSVSRVLSWTVIYLRRMLPHGFKLWLVPPEDMCRANDPHTVLLRIGFTANPCYHGSG